MLTPMTCVLVAFLAWNKIPDTHKLKEVPVPGWLAASQKGMVGGHSAGKQFTHGNQEAEKEGLSWGQ